MQQTLICVSLNDVKKGSDALGCYAMDLKTKWFIFNVPDVTAGWISSQVSAQTGLTPAPANSISQVQSWHTHRSLRCLVQRSTGSACRNWPGRSPSRAANAVAIAPMVSQKNSIDDNAYANSGRTKFMNTALINSEVLPLGQYNFGFNLQWQPLDEWYGMIGGSAGNGTAGLPPWDGFT